jgi:hypothetical protein
MVRVSAIGEPWVSVTIWDLNACKQDHSSRKRDKNFKS